MRWPRRTAKGGKIPAAAGIELAAWPNALGRASASAQRESVSRRCALRVLFVWLNHDTPVGFSHGLAVLSAELKAAGHSVEVIHINEQLGAPFDLARLEAELARRSPDVVGLSFGSNHAAAAAQVSSVVRKLHPECWILVGGAHATLYPEQVMSWPNVDIAALGEVDDFRLVQVVEDLGRSRLPEGRAGFWYRRQRGAVGAGIVRNPIGMPVDLERSRPMDLELFDHGRILQLKRGWADVQGGRGCPQRCSYCFNEPLRRRYLDELGCASKTKLKYVRKRPIGVVLEELEQYRRLYGQHIRVFSFTDDQFVTSRRWAYEFLEAYRERFEYPLVLLGTPASIDAEMAERFARAGVYMVRMGVESGSARVREQILHRNAPAEVIERAVSTLQRAGVNAFAFQMLGIPGESIREVWDTFRFGARLRTDALKFSNFWPYPGTELYQHCLREGLVREGLEFVGNNIDDSPLRWPAARQLLFRRLSKFYDVALNRFLYPNQATGYGDVLRQLRTMPETSWNDGGSIRLRRQANDLNQATLSSGKEVYIAPFGDRPDVLLLQGRERVRPLLM